MRPQRPRRRGAGRARAPARRGHQQRRRVPRPAARPRARARALGATEVEVVNDSELVAKQVQGLYKVKHPAMRPLHAQAMAALRRVRALVDPLGAARAERRSRRARQRRARRGAACDAQRPQPRAARPGARRAAGDGGLRGDLHPGRERPGNRTSRSTTPQRVADLRRRSSSRCAWPGTRDPPRAAERRSLPVPARGGAGERRDRDGLPDQPDAGAPAGAVDDRRARAVRGHDRRAAAAGATCGSRTTAT